MRDKKPFFIGIGGSGMSSLAHILLDLKIDVSGYDKAQSDTVKKLEMRGARITHDPENVNLDGIDYIVYSSAVKENHPVFQKALSLHKTLIHRSELLHELFSKKFSIAVAGSHGKTTTTAMTGQILLEAGERPSIMLGGEVGYLNDRGGKWDNGKWGVYESDESDGTFLNHKADIKIVTNIDNDHLDFYKTTDALLEAFAKFIHNKKSSTSIVYLGDKGVEDAIDLLEDQKNIIGYIEASKAANLSAKFPELQIEPFEIFDNELSFFRQGEILKIKLPYAGDHYLKNSFAALLAAETAGIEVHASIEILNGYTGVKRRLELLGNQNNIHVYDDYGHHPTEILAVIQSIKRMRPVGAKCCILFQPHRYTRTRDHYEEFAKALDESDLLFLLPIYSAGESPIEGISTELIYDHLVNKERTILLTGDISRDVSILKKYILSGDYLVSLGAGNVRSWA
ncbi:MAG TPA: UDP-N-acetylmuramate--L-alanine ligase, partial [Leptospiraceae bacterium]|nr:UDP-N-acetylmuramate--L-alanine ligase [Leptospiraceae bacterium]